MLYEILKPYMTEPRTYKKGDVISRNLEYSESLLFVLNGSVLLQYFDQSYNQNYDYYESCESIGILQSSKTWLGLEYFSAEKSELITKVIANDTVTIRKIALRDFNYLLKGQLKSYESDIYRLTAIELIRKLNQANELRFVQNRKKGADVTIEQIKRLSKIIGKPHPLGTELTVTAALLSKLTAVEPDAIRKHFTKLTRSNRITRSGMCSIVLLR